MNKRNDLVGGELKFDSSVEISELELCVDELKNSYNFKRLFVRKYGRDKRALEFVADCEEGHENLMTFKDDIDRFFNDKFRDRYLGADITLGLTFLLDEDIS